MNGLIEVRRVMEAARTLAAVSGDRKVRFDHVSAVWLAAAGRCTPEDELPKRFNNDPLVTRAKSALPRLGIFQRRRISTEMELKAALGRTLKTGVVDIRRVLAIAVQSGKLNEFLGASKVTAGEMLTILSQNRE